MRAIAHTEARPQLLRIPVGKARANDPEIRIAPRNALAAKADGYRNRQQPPASKAAEPNEDTAADTAMQDRVHAWVQQHGQSAPHTVVEDPDPTLALTGDASGQRSTKATAKAKPPVAIAPDLATTPHKATVEDFDRAVQRQTQSQRATAAQNESRSTSEDAAAAALAESHIPSTAPTARVPLPFTHGDLLGSAPAGKMTANVANVAQQPATLTARTPDAPAPRQVETRSDAAVLATTASAADAGVPSAPLRIVSAEAASSSTPKLQLPRPAPVVRNAPATSAIAAAAKHPVLDQGVVAGMSDETFDNDAPAPTAATAIALAGKTKASTIATAAAVGGDLDTPGTGSVTKVDLYDSRGRLRLFPAMKGSHDILVHQNQMAVADGLDRIEDDNQLYDMRRLKLLVALPDNDAMEVNEALPANRRCARPWAVRFLNDLSRAHFARFHTPLIITSAVRTVAFQRRLVLTNGNAAPPTGDIASPHLYGQAIDLGKRGMGITEIAWMRAYLTPIEDEGKIDVEEEFQQACFHISVYRRYLGLPVRTPEPRRETVSAHPLLQAKAAPATKHRRLPTALLATGLR